MVEMASGVGLVWACRDGVGVSVAAAVPGVAAVPLALSVLAALVPVDVAVPSSTVSAIALALVLSEPRSLFVASACACCSAVARG